MHLKSRIAQRTVGIVWKARYVTEDVGANLAFEFSFVKFNYAKLSPSAVLSRRPVVEVS